jgi:hypothetical protein
MLIETIQHSAIDLQQSICSAWGFRLRGLAASARQAQAPVAT